MLRWMNTSMSCSPSAASSSRYGPKSAMPTGSAHELAGQVGGGEALRPGLRVVLSRAHGRPRRHGPRDGRQLRVQGRHAAPCRLGSSAGRKTTTAPSSSCALAWPVPHGRGRGHPETPAPGRRRAAAARRGRWAPTRRSRTPRRAAPCSSPPPRRAEQPVSRSAAGRADLEAHLVAGITEATAGSRGACWPRRRADGTRMPSERAGQARRRRDAGSRDGEDPRRLERRGGRRADARGLGELVQRGGVLADEGAPCLVVGW